DISSWEFSIRNKEQAYRSAVERGASDHVFGQEEELQTAQQQHQLASRLLRLKVRKLDGLEERLTGLFLQDMEKTLQDVQETNQNTGETVTVSRLTHSKEQEREAHRQAKTFVQEMIDAFSRPPLTENALLVLESLGVSAKKREALRENLGLVVEDTNTAVETEEPEDEDDLPESGEVEKIPETTVDETVLKSRIGIRETVEAENPWLSASAPFFPDLSVPGNGIQVSLFDDLFSPAPGSPAAVSLADGSPAPWISSRPPTVLRPASPVPDVILPIPKTIEGEPEVIMEKPENVPIVAENAPVPGKTVATPASKVENQPVLQVVPPAIRGFLSNSQRMATEHGLRGEEREYFSNKMRELEQVIRAMPHTHQTDGQGDNAPVTLHYFKGQADWYITEKDIDPDGAGQTQAFGLADLGMGYPEMGYISIQELVQAGVEMDYHFAQRTLLELKREKYPEMIRDRAPENVPAPNLSHEGVLFYRGGPDTSFPAGKTIEDIIDYERNELENDIHIIPENMDYQRVLPVASLQWVTDTKEEAEEYGTAQEVWFNDPVVIARDSFGGMLVGERKDLDAALLSHNRAPENTPAPDVKGDPALSERDAEAPKQSQNTFFTGDVPKKEGQTIAEMITRWGDSGITVLADDRVTPYLQMPSNTGSLRVILARHPDELQQEPVTEVEYKQPVILATLPENAVLVAEQSYLDAYRSTLNPVQDTQENTLDTLASWITPDQMIALRNASNDNAHTNLPHTMRWLNTVANRLRDPLHFGPGHRPISTPRVAEIQAGAGLNIMTYRSPDSLHWWFITGMDQDSGLLYGLQMVRSRPDSRWEAQMGPVSRQDLLDAGFLLELMQDTPFVVADRMHEMAPYIGGVDALPANGPTALVDRADATVITPVNAATDLKIMEQIVFDSRIPASGHTIGDMLGDLRENGVNLIATSDVINQYFYMERSESVRV
ncbi:DUF2958 domain-containing protein, partial [Acidithiobacillus ferrivorans]|nr:DUF2958 domain-containing protein [Acidithiobacillus ferrivorans]